MWSKSQTIVLVLLVVVFSTASGVAAERTDQSKFAIVDTTQGAIKYNVTTGESWLLDTKDEPVWLTIGHENTAGQPDEGLRFEDIEWLVLLTPSGETRGIEVKKFKRQVVLESIKEGDIIVAVNGNPIAGLADLRRELRAALEAEEPSKLTVQRDGEEIKVTFQYPFK